MLNTKSSLLLAVVVCLATTSVAFSAYSWSDASGANPRFGWSNGQNSDSNYFGDPVISEAGFVFSPTAFKAEVTTPGVGDVAADISLVDVSVFGAVPPGAGAVTEFRVTEWGTYQGDQSHFSVQADVSVLRLNPYQGNTGSLDLGWGGVDGAIDWDWDGPGTWRMERTDFLDDPLNWNIFSVTYSNSIQVSGEASLGDFIQKTGAKIIVPEPGTLLLLVVGYGAAFWRRSRR